MHEAKTTLSQLVERAKAGEDIVISRNGKPVARLVPVTGSASLAAVRGAWSGRVDIAEDFDELPDDVGDRSALDEAAALISAIRLTASSSPRPPPREPSS